MGGNTGDGYGTTQGTGEHTCNFSCFDTIGRMICCYCGALAYPEDLVRQGLQDIKEGRYRVINGRLFKIDKGSPPIPRTNEGKVYD